MRVLFFFIRCRLLHNYSRKLLSSSSSKHFYLFTIFLFLSVFENHISKMCEIENAPIIVIDWNMNEKCTLFRRHQMHLIKFLRNDFYHIFWFCEDDFFPSFWFWTKNMQRILYIIRNCVSLCGNALIYWQIERKSIDKTKPNRRACATWFLLTPIVKSMQQIRNGIVKKMKKKYLLCEKILIKIAF